MCEEGVRGRLEQMQRSQEREFEGEEFEVPFKERSYGRSEWKEGTY